MDPKELKDAIDALGASWKAYRETNDARLVAIEAKQGTAELDAKLKKIESDVAESQAKINRMNLGGGISPSQRPSAAAKELGAWARTAGLNGEFKAAISTDSNVDGGYVVIPEIDMNITRVAEKQVAMRSLAAVRTTGKNSIVLFKNKGGVSGGWVAETGARNGNNSNPQIARIEIFAHEIYAEPKSTQDGLDDIGFDVPAWLAEKCAISFSENEDAAFISGDGDSKPKGFLAHTMVANASYVWEKIGYILSGKSAAFADTTPADKIIDLIHALKAKYRGGASFLCNDLTLAEARKIKDGDGNYLWQPSFQLGIPEKLSGYPVAVSDNMPDIAANSYALAFGNFKAGYQIVDRAGISILRDPYTEKGFVKFYTKKRVGGDVQNFEAIKVMKFAAS